MPKLIITIALVFAASISGCSRSTSLPPLVEGPATSQIPGKFVWHNLVTGDGEAARKFYGELFGWEFELKDEGRYSVIRYQGRNLGGILDTSKEGKTVKGGHWLSAMSVPDLEASLAAVGKAGGTQLEAEPAVHTWLWHELLANHRDRAVEFYRSAFGYSVEELKKKPGSEYRVLWSSGEARAGILQNPFEKTRSAWIPYVRVDDPAALAERVPGLGGRVVLAPRPDVRDGTLALVLDPSGAPLALQHWTPEGEVSP